MRSGSPSAPLQREQIVFMPRDRRRDDVSLTLIDDPPRVPGPSSHHVTVRTNGLGAEGPRLEERAERLAGSGRPGGERHDDA